MVPRETGPQFAIDANRINSRQKLAHMNRLEKWDEDGIISILMPETAHSEARQGRDLARRLKTSFNIFTMNTLENSSERELRREVAEILSPGQQPDRNTANDIDIIVNAHKYGCILITADGGSRRQPGGILGHKEQLRALRIMVVTDSEAVAMVEERIRRRDEAEIKLAHVEGREPAWWVGQDL